MRLVRYSSVGYVGFVDPHYDGEELRALLANPAGVGDREGAELIPTRPGRIVHRLGIETPSGRCEVYTHLLTNAELVESLRRPYAYTVLRIGRRMLASGLPTARVLAAIRPRWQPLNRTSFAVTLGIPHAVPLSSLSPDEFEGEGGGFKKTQLIRQVAGQTAWMHAHGFYHCDLVAPNILIERRRSVPVIWFVGLSRAQYARWQPPLVRQSRWTTDLAALLRSDIQVFNEHDRRIFLDIYLRAIGHTRGANLVRVLLDRRGGI